MNTQQVNELVLQSLEQEIGGIQVYETALKCAINEDLRDEWKKYLEQTRNHERILRGVCKALDVDAAKETPGRTILRSLGGALVDAMETALAAGKREAAELVACECVVLAETKDHFDWELIGKCAENLEGEAAKVLAAAYEEVEDQEDEHVYHTKGWARELWIEALGMPAVLPPPEEVQDAGTATGAQPRSRVCQGEA